MRKVLIDAPYLVYLMKPARVWSATEGRGSVNKPPVLEAINAAQLVLEVNEAARDAGHRRPGEGNDEGGD